MTLGWPESFIEMTVNGLCYQRYSRHLLLLQKLTWNSTRTPAFQAASGFFETNREVPTFFFQNCRKFLQLKTPTLRAKKVGRKPDPRVAGTCKSPGVAREGGWSGLELTDTLMLFLISLAQIIYSRKITWPLPKAWVEVVFASAYS